MTTTKPALLRIEELSAELGPPVRLIRTWMHQRKIPFIKTGRRTVLFQREKVQEALARFEVKAVGQRSNEKIAPSNAVVRTTSLEG